MNGVEHEEIVGHPRGLLIRLDDRLSSTDCALIAESVDVGELGLAVEQMADQLSEYSRPLAADERADLLALVERIQMTDRAVRALTTCPDR